VERKRFVRLRINLRTKFFFAVMGGDQVDEIKSLDM
jgi:hypothetical protein